MARPTESKAGDGDLVGNPGPTTAGDGSAGQFDDANGALASSPDTHDRCLRRTAAHRVRFVNAEAIVEKRCDGTCELDSSHRSLSSARAAVGVRPLLPSSLVRATVWPASNRSPPVGRFGCTVPLGRTEGFLGL